MSRLTLARQIMRGTCAFLMFVLIAEVTLFRSSRLFQSATIPSVDTSSSDDLSTDQDNTDQINALRSSKEATSSPTIGLTMTPTNKVTVSPTLRITDSPSKPSPTLLPTLSPTFAPTVAGQGEMELLSALPGYHSTTVTHVYIPFFLGQLGKMGDTIYHYWKTFPPCESSEDYNRINDWRRDENNKQEPPTIVFMIGRRASNETEKEGLKNDEDLIAKVRAGINIPPELAVCFAPKITFCVQRLTPKQDEHLTGSRILFERMLEGKCIRGKRGYALYMEPDLRPVNKYWLTQLMIRGTYPNPASWAIGPIYRGQMGLPASMLNLRFHMNYNGLVRLSNYMDKDEKEKKNVAKEAFRPILTGSFADFYFNAPRAYIIAIAGAEASRWFDTDISYYLMQPEHIGNFTDRLVHRFQFTDLFVNLVNTWYAPLLVGNIYGNAALMVHGGSPEWDPTKAAAITVIPEKQVELSVPGNWSEEINGTMFITKEFSTVSRRAEELKRFQSNT